MIDNQEQIQKKISGVADLDLKLKLIAISHLVDKRKQLDKEQEKEIKALEKQLNNRFTPYLESTNDIVNGIRAPTAAEIEKLDSYLAEKEKENKDSYVKNQDPIYAYWMKALQNAQPIKEDITKKDEAILVSLTRIECSSDPLNDDFTLTFTFKQNDYFTNEVLKVQYHINDDQEPLKIESTPIVWREGKDITKKIVKKKKNKKVKVKEVEQESFFNIFRNTDSLSEQFKTLTEDQKEESTYKMNVSFEIGSIIYNEVIPYSLEYYLGIRVNDDYDDDGNEYDDEDEEDVEDDVEMTKEKAIELMKARFKPQGKKK